MAKHTCCNWVPAAASKAEDTAPFLDNSRESHVMRLTNTSAYKNVTSVNITIYYNNHFMAIIQVNLC